MDAKLIRPAAKGALAFILPNINADLRTLPANVPDDLTDSSKAVKLDKEQSVRRPTDPQLYELRIQVTAAERSAHPALRAEIEGLGPLFVLLDASGQAISMQLDLAALFQKSTKIIPDTLTFFFEAETFAASPLTPSPPLMIKVSFTDNSQVLASVSLPLFVSDLILLGDNEPPSRLYIADISDNQPTLSEVRDAVRSTGVSLVTVPEVVCNGDTWLQDQFQLAVAVDDMQRLQSVVVHLPRMRSNSQIVASANNLGGFVDNHFPSRDIGVFKDFWNSSIPIPVSNPSGGGSTLQLSIKDSSQVLNSLMPVTRTWAQITTAVGQLGGQAQSTAPTPFFTKRTQLANQVNILKSTPAGSPDEKKAKDALVMALTQKIGDIDTAMPRTSGGMRLSINNNVVELTEAVINDLFDRLVAIHSGSNYGGNIEVSPPTSNAPLGTIVTGDVDGRDLQTFLGNLKSQSAAQPWVQMGTSWLSVGHIDEIATFLAPRSSGLGTPVVLRASPRLALLMLDAAKSAKGAGKLVTRLFRGKRWRHEETRTTSDPLLPPRAYIYLTARYGKYDLSELHKPTDYIPFGPSAFFDDRKYLIFLRGNGDPRDYAAHMSVEELLDICRDANQTIDEVFLGSKAKSGAKQADYPLLKGIAQQSIDDILKQSIDSVVPTSFSGSTLVPLPVVFDRVESFFTTTTEAFTPGLVNMQQLNSAVLVPRPYGPRMRPADAIDLLSSLLKEDAPTGLAAVLRTSVLKSLKPASLHSRGLDVTTHWTSPSQSCIRFDPASLNKKGYADAVETLDVIAEIFRDGFDEFVNPDRDYTKNDTSTTQTARNYFNNNIDAVRRRIAGANPAAFDAKGYVKGNGWVRLVIPENTVDLFEVYTQLVLEALGFTVKWVDSWFYHVHAGGIHCATNVLRNVTPADMARRAAAAQAS